MVLSFRLLPCESSLSLKKTLIEKKNLVFFIKCFFSTQDCAFPMSRGSVNFVSFYGHSGCCWTSLCLFESFLKIPVNLIRYSGAVQSFNNRHSAREIKYCTLFLWSHYHNNIFELPFCFCNSGFFCSFLLTVLFVIKQRTFSKTKNSKKLFSLNVVTETWIVRWLYCVLLLSGSEAELNPRPEKRSINTFSIFHCNLNRISSDNYAKIFLLRVYMAILKSCIISISDIYFDSNDSPDDNYMEMSGYNLIWSEDLSNNKREEVFVYIVHIFYLW